MSDSPIRGDIVEETWVDNETIAVTVAAADAEETWVEYYTFDSAERVWAANGDTDEEDA